MSGRATQKVLSCPATQLKASDRGNQSTDVASVWCPQKLLARQYTSDRQSSSEGESAKEMMVVENMTRGTGTASLSHDWRLVPGILP